MKIDGKDEGCFLRSMNCGCYGCLMTIVAICALLFVAWILNAMLPD